MKINIGEVLSKAWQIIWKFKVLWIFGILAGCGGANGSRFNYNFNNRSFGNSGQMPDFLRGFNNLQPERFLQYIWNQFSGFIFGLIFVLCCLWIVFYVLGVIGRIGLIQGVGKADAGAERLSFAEIWTGSTPYFWRMFGLNLLVGLPFFILFVLLIGGTVAAGYWAYVNNPSVGGSTAAAAILGMIGVVIGALCLISILAIIIGMIVEQAQNAIVLENLGVFAGLSRGWKVFKSAILTIIVMAIIMAIIGSLVGLLFALPAFLIAIPLAASLFAGAQRSMALIWLITAGCILCYLPVVVVLNGILMAYTQSVWTLVYRRLTATPAAAVVEAVPAP